MLIFFFFFLAEQVTNNLKELAQQVTPGDIVSTYGVRKAMGISIPSPVAENNFVDLTEGTCLCLGRAEGSMWVKGLSAVSPQVTSAKLGLFVLIMHELF